MTIAFFHNGSAFLPEIDAYIDYFRKRNFQCVVIHPHQKTFIDFDVEWHFMGMSKRRKKNSILIHEYGSLSVPPLIFFKNLIKKKFNDIPDFRIFLNESIRESLNFRDDIPFGLRDMGIDPSWNENKNIEKRNDFIYIGSTDKNRKIEPLLDCFVNGKMSPFNILILSKNYDFLKKKYSSYNNISFEGPVNRNDILFHLQSSRYAINYIPDTYPFNIQSSTKFLEYNQLKIPIITTNYSWIQSFERIYGGNFYYLKNDLSNFDMELINPFPFAFSDLSSWSWEQQIEKSGILHFLQSK